MIPFLCTITRNNGFAVDIARPKLSSLLIGNKSLSRGSMYDIKNSIFVI